MDGSEYAIESFDLDLYTPTYRVSRYKHVKYNHRESMPSSDGKSTCSEWQWKQFKVSSLLPFREILVLGDYDNRTRL